jgi:hypothetical protein
MRFFTNQLNGRFREHIIVVGAERELDTNYKFKEFQSVSTSTMRY